MRKYILLAIACLSAISANAQYLLEEEAREPKEQKVKEAVFRDSFDVSFGRGYRGFFDVGLGLCTSSVYTGYGNYYYDYGGGTENYSMIMFSTTHGYQILDDYLFVGGGIGLWYMYSAGGCAVPLFVDARSDFYNFGKVSLFGDLKLGYSVADQTGFYFDPTIGARYGLTDRIGINLGIGFQYFNNGALDYESGSGLGYFNIKIGVDF